MKKVGLLTWHYYDNFGSALQAFALQSFLHKHCIDSRFINYKNEKIDSISDFGHAIRYQISILLGRINKSFYKPYTEFRKKFLKQTKTYWNVDELKKVQKKYDCFICGSDQIWAPNVFNPIYMFNFVDEGKKIMSYAASIGLDAIPKNLVPTYSSLLKKFSSISMREESGANIIKKTCGIDKIETVLDPTFLLNTQDYMKMEKKVKVNEKYVFCYFLNQNNNYKNRVLKYANENKCKVVGFSSNINDSLWMKNITWIGPREFLWLIHNAKAVFTDSYHGTIFSLLYHKEFFIFERFSNSDTINQNSRIYHLVKWFFIGKQIISSSDDTLISFEYNYTKFEKLLEFYRKLSSNYLLEAVRR